MTDQEEERIDYIAACPYCGNETVVSSSFSKYESCEHCDMTYQLIDGVPTKTQSKFRYKNGSPISFYKCENCGDIITGCMHHQLEHCTCGDYINQETTYFRMSGEFTNVSDDITDEEKRIILTKTIFNYDNCKEEFITQRIKYPGFISDIFDIKEYKRLYKEWKKKQELVKND